MLEQELEVMRQVFCVTLRARSVNDKASDKNWQWSKFSE